MVDRRPDCRRASEGREGWKVGLQTGIFSLLRVCVCGYRHPSQKQTVVSLGENVHTREMSSSTKKRTQTNEKARFCPSFSSTAIPPANSDVLKNLAHVVQPHVESFDFFLGTGMIAAVRDIPSVIIQNADGTGPVITVGVENVAVGYPARTGANFALDSRVFPSECRERGESYTAPMTVTFNVRFNNEPPQLVSRSFPSFPIMTRSTRCHLRGLTPFELVKRHEEGHEFGGTFISNGIERLIRMLQIPKRNHPMAIDRPSFRKRGPNYSSKACTIRCVRPDQSAVSISLHYLLDGGAIIRFSLNKQEFFIPAILVMKALVETTDQEIYNRVVAEGNVDSAFVSGRIELILGEAKRYNLFTRGQHLAYIGARFRTALRMPICVSDVQVGQFLIRRFLFVHLSEEECEIGPLDQDPSEEETRRALQVGQRKFDLLVLMFRKLYAFVTDDVLEDNADSLMNQEILTPGHLMLMIVKEKVEEFMNGVKLGILKDLRGNKPQTESQLHDIKYFQKIMGRQGDIAEKIKYFLATGNLVSTSGLDLMQASGYTIVAEKLNYYRFLAHFRCVHRGAFFTTMKTTTVRKLLPESWGFLCPVHTPDGGPCGLLQHLASAASIVCDDNRALTKSSTDELADEMLGVLSAIGLNSLGRGNGRVIPGASELCVVLDGRVLGSVTASRAATFVNQLRALKVLGQRGVPKSMEVAYFPPVDASSLEEKNGDSKTAEPDRKRRGPYPGIYLATAAARLIRPVWHRKLDEAEMLGPMEQVFLDVACTDDECLEADAAAEVESKQSRSPDSDTDEESGDKTSAALTFGNVPTHVEIDPTNMLSVIASLTPFSDFNQSPRNMYQCQMGKQTMGTPMHSFAHRTDNKLYRIQSPQCPITQNQGQRKYGMDEYPNGTNAVVCVISYTGYDMEDAMIINKSAMERGFGHGTVYKTLTFETSPSSGEYFGNVDPRGDRRKNKAVQEGGGDGDIDIENRKGSGTEGVLIAHSKGKAIGTPEGTKLYYPSLDRDGFPPIGAMIQGGEPLCCIVNQSTGQGRAMKHKGSEPAYVDEVRLISENMVKIKVRFNRNPVVGDKFSSRHGQKGVMSVLWPQRDMPFTESGMSPDIIINPHAFPSRMTIGMLVESMAGKAGALHGVYQDSTPFQFHENQHAVDYFGEQLKAAGYNYYGSEPLYSGVDGREMHAEIFIGCVYYQRLRHMVSDKSQVRSTGPINVLTRQPIKGRKKGGGIRFGEMERDSFIAHGAAFLMQDRLMNCSDKHVAFVCKTCGSLLGPTAIKNSTNAVGGLENGGFDGDEEDLLICRTKECQSAKSKSDIARVSMPYVFRYLANELGAMNIKMKLHVD